MNTLRRYELCWPQPPAENLSITDDCFVEVMRELSTRFGAAFRDGQRRVFVDVPDTVANREFFVGFKEQLKGRFQQFDIWLTTYPIETL